MIAVLLSFLMMGGSWAYWTQELQVTNEYRLALYKTDIIDIFESPGDWQPGSKAAMEISIDNDGELPIYVKAVLQQKWLRTENVYDPLGQPVPPAQGETFPLIFMGDDGLEYAAQINWGSEVVLLCSGKTSALSPSLGLPTVATAKEAENKWLLMQETPDENGDYTLYYIGALAGGKTSPLLTDSVNMNRNIRATILEDTTVWDKQTQQWITNTIPNRSYSYENARYTLSVTMQTVQATLDALSETFRADNTAEQAVISSLGDWAYSAPELNYGYDDAVALHKLYFEEINGRMRFTPVRHGQENWFMSGLNMAPGGAYEHMLLVENRSPKTYDLYMQVAPLDQPGKADELLEYIYMKVYCGATLIYDGTAGGKAYAGSINDLYNAISLGNYQPGAENLIRAKLLVAKHIPQEYAGILATINWKFIAEEPAPPTPPSPTKPTPPNPPTPQPMPPNPDKPAQAPPSPDTPEAGPPGPATPEAAPADTATPEAGPAGTTTSPPPSPSLTGPKTGDYGISGLWYILLMSLGSLWIMGSTVFLIRTRKRQ
jgi:alternate signal-mediated exported protein